MSKLMACLNSKIRVLACAVATFTMFFAAQATSYSWVGAGVPNADGTYNWEDSANWLKDGKTVVTAGYPGLTDKGAVTAGDTVLFDKVMTNAANVKLSTHVNLAYLKFTDATYPVTLIGDTPNGTNDVMTLSNEFNLDTSSQPVTFDHIAIYRNGYTYIGVDRTVTLKNGANIQFNNTLYYRLGSKVAVTGGSLMRVNGLNLPDNADSNTRLDITGGSTFLCWGDANLYKNSCAFGLSVKDKSQLLFQDAAGTTFKYLVMGGPWTVEITGGSLMRMSELDIGVAGQTITIDDSTLEAMSGVILSYLNPGGTDVIFKGAKPQFIIRGNYFRARYNDGAVKVPCVFRYVVPEGGYAVPPLQYLSTSTTAAFGGYGNPTYEAKFVVDTSSPAYTAGTQTIAPLAYSIPGFYWKAKTNFIDISDTSTGSIYFTDGEGNQGVTTDAAAKYIRATIGAGDPATPPTVETTAVAPAVVVAVNRKTLTATASITQKSTVAAKTVIELYAGLTADVAEVVATREITAYGAYDLTWTAPANMFEKNYVHWFVVTDYDENGNVLATSTSGQATAKTLDKTTYTWTGEGAEGDWTDPDNWSDNQGGDCLHWPGTAAASAVFTANSKTTIIVKESVLFGILYINNAGADLTFVADEGVTTNDVKWTFSQINMNAASTKLTFDGVAFSMPGVQGGSYSKVTIRNGANVYMSGDFWMDNYCTLELTGDSYLSCNQFGMGGGDCVIEDSTLFTRSHDKPGNAKKGGSLTFRGTHPIWWHNNSGGYFYSSLANANFQFNFLVPVGGYAVAPIRAIATQSYLAGNNGGSAGSAPITFNILDESPANRVDDTITTTLIDWPKGINTAMILAGTLPEDAALTGDEWVWGEGTTPTTLGVKIVGTTHANELKITGAPEAIASGDIAPAYGFHAAGDVGSTLVCAAPADVVQVSETKRATVTGWKLYAVDAATRVRTLVTSGTGNTYTYANEDGLWHELEWQWKIEYLVTAASAGNGTASVKTAWVETGTKAYFTATPDAGYGFFKWTGDVAEERNKTHDLFITVRDKPYALTANFLPTVTATTNDLAAFVATNANKIILLGDELYPVTKQIVVGANTIIRGNRAKGSEPIVKATTRISLSSTADGSIFKLTHADAALDGIAITTDWPNMNTFNNYDCARGVWIEGAGLVDHCVITNCRSLYTASEGGGGVFMNGGGIVRNTKIFDCRAYASGGNNAQGAAVYMKTGGLVETCEIRKCGLSGPNSANTSSSAAVAMKDGGTLRNSLIADCSQGHSSGDQMRGIALYINPSTATSVCTIDNCTIAGNYQMASTVCGGVDIFTSSATKLIMRNNIIWNNYNSMGVMNWWQRYSSYAYTSQNNCTTPVLAGTNEIDADPAFTDAANGDYTLGYTASVDSALYLDWMDDVLDLAGNERCIGSAPDRGCYEFKVNGLAAGFTVEQEGTLDEATVTLVASVLGDTEGIFYTWTLTDQDGKTTVQSGADLATTTFDVGIGRYSVTLGVVNGAGESCTVEKPSCAEVSPANIYVAKDGSGTYPYSSYETGATTLTAALAAATDGTTIHVMDGFYTESDTLTLTHDIVIVSENGPEVTKVHATAQTSGNPMVIMGSANAVISGLTLTGYSEEGKVRSQWGGLTILAAGGTATNCWIRENETVSISVCGAGARLEGGTVVDCFFTNNWTRCSGGGGQKGGAIYMTGSGALVDRCRIVGNKVADGGVSYGGGVYLNAGMIRNSLIDSNFCQSYGGGAAVDGSGVLQNCTVVRNSSISGNGGIWQAAGKGTVTDCLSWGNIVNGGSEGEPDPGFVDATGGDFHLNSASAAIDAGTAAKPGAYDLDRTPRVSGTAADWGCYEYDQSQFDVGIGYEKVDNFAPGVVRFYASVMPSTVELDPEQTWWTFDGTEPSAENYAAKGMVVDRTVEPGHVTVRFKTIYQGETYAIDKPEWFDYYGEKVYIRKDAENPVFPYATPETATADYAAGLEALQEDATAVFGAGMWTVPKTFTLSKRCTVMGAGPGKTIIDQNSAKDWSTKQAFVLDNADALVTGITFQNASGWNPGGSIVVNAGTVTNCAFANCFVYGGASGGAVVLYAGLIADCTITSCGASVYNADGTSKGAALYASGNAVVERCVINGTRNISKAGHVENGDGAVYLLANTSGAPTMRNSVVANSVLGYCGGIITYDNVRIENCTVVNNASTNATDKIGGIRCEGAAPTIVNTVVWNNTVKGQTSDMGGTAATTDTCLIGTDPLLRGGGTHAFRPRPDSPVVDQAKTLDWMTGAKDVYGRDRCAGKGPDIGAAEAFTEGLMLLVK